ncbi:hypothetical protein THASP1DRAFT_31349 [Thamnocephalis sphaerospora]|uniref:Uncharacterized protein n=1 Tax=Thamnocephalis sphaerospora TaxID=78915 RepID=A0A4P9XNM5_9FUNG|nr:hypothetical protein THASP1DRAFT_31349 [Thamnocephalis sphaerospora]|eukprot:RKP06840.1 hypothetical protein THASP1DRAFT_31349 [Thamnocephalis sphaerospora]
MLPRFALAAAVTAVALASIAYAQSVSRSVNIGPKQVWGECSDGPVDKVFVNVTAAASSVGVDGVYIVDEASYNTLRTQYNGTAAITPPGDVLRFNGQANTTSLACEKLNGYRVRNCTIGDSGPVTLSPKAVACLVVSNAVSQMPVPVNVALTFGNPTTNPSTGGAERGRTDATLLLGVLLAAIALGPVTQLL